MPRYHVHLIPMSDAHEFIDPVVTVTLNARNEADAQTFAWSLLVGDADIQEIELVEEESEAQR